MFCEENNLKKAKKSHYLYQLQKTIKKFLKEIREGDLTKTIIDEIDSDPPSKNYPTRKGYIFISEKYGVLI